MTPQGNPKNLCVGELERDKRIRVKSIIKKRKNFNQQTKVSVRVIKDNSISLLEFVFDLNFDEIIFFFLKILLKLFRINIHI